VFALAENAWLLPRIFSTLAIRGCGIHEGGRMDGGGFGIEVRLRKSVMSVTTHGVPSTRTCRIER
jgi:hypothetical protein